MWLQRRLAPWSHFGASFECPNSIESEEVFQRVCNYIVGSFYYKVANSLNSPVSLRSSIQVIHGPWGPIVESICAQRRHAPSASFWRVYMKNNWGLFCFPWLEALRAVSQVQVWRYTVGSVCLDTLCGKWLAVGSETCRQGANVEKPHSHTEEVLRRWTTAHNEDATAKPKPFEWRKGGLAFPGRGRSDSVPEWGRVSHKRSATFNFDNYPEKNAR